MTTAVAEWGTLVFTGLIALTGVFALLYARKELLQSREDTRIRHLIDFNRQFSEEPMALYRAQAARAYLAGKKDPREIYFLMTFFETIGLLVERGYLGQKEVWELFASTVFPLYAAVEPLIQDERRTDPNMYSNFERLRNRLRQTEKEEGGPTAERSEEEILSFWQDEEAVVPGTPPTGSRRVRKRSKAVAAPGAGEKVSPPEISKEAPPRGGTRPA